MLNILYIGPNNSEWAQVNRPVSLAAAKWARGFLTALSKIANVTALTHTYEVAWPKGRVFWRGYDDRLYPKEWECVAINYPALKYIREIWWRFEYAAKAKRILRDKRIDVVLMYNCNESWQLPVLKAIKRNFPRVKVVPIILDGDDPRKDNWGWMKRAAVYSDAFVSLSWWVYQNIPANTGIPSYHFDGGAEGWRGINEIRSASKAERWKKLVHTGTLDRWRGLDFMIKVVEKVTAKHSDVKFVFCGKSSENVLRELFGANSHVELPGFVREEEMTTICNSATALLNVRDPNHPDNILNYPSKLPHYLSFGRPIVSTRLQSLSPDYDEVVHFPDDNSVDAYVRKLEEILEYGDKQREMEYGKIKAWFESRKSWDVMVEGLLDWITNNKRLAVND